MAASLLRPPRRAACRAPRGLSGALRGHSYAVSRWSQAAAAAASRLVTLLGGAAAEERTEPRAHPRAATAVAAAAREAAAAAARRSAARAARPAPPPLARLGGLSEEASGLGRRAGPAALHALLVAQGALKGDAAQRTAVGLLDELRARLLRRGRRGSGLPVCPSGPPADGPLGVYLHGPVGCGKTLLMDLFAASLVAGPELRLRRAHFHDFMAEVQEELHAGRHFDGPGELLTARPALVEGERWWLLGAGDDRGRRRTGRAAACVLADRRGGALSSAQRAAARVAAGLDVLCFDELAITTIQDCVLLAPLFRTLLACGVSVVATSNRAPEDLYAGGLNRHIHLPPFVQALHEGCVVHAVPSMVDYRAEAERTGQDSGALLWCCEPGSQAGRLFLEAWWERLLGEVRTGSVDRAAPGAVLRQTCVGYGRQMPVWQSPCGSVAKFRFPELCGVPLAAEDYSALCTAFSCLLVEGVPELRGADAAEEARRWTLFLDCCYEHGGALVATFQAASPDAVIDLATVAEVGAGGGRSLQETAFAASRAISRLREMRTASYWSACSRARGRP